MIIYDDTQHHQGIDLEGNDINKAKFPRIERDGLFIDEVRSNPTTGLLEIWDGTQWLGYIDTGTLPEGTANQTLRHNGTEWVATDKLLIEDNNQDYSTTTIKNDIVEFMSNTIIDGYAYQIGGFEVADNDVADANLGNISTQYIYNPNSNLEVQYNSVNISNIHSEIRFSHDYRPNGNGVGIPRNRFDVDIAIDGIDLLQYRYDTYSIEPKHYIKMKLFEGTGSALLEALPDGTVQRSTSTMPAAQIQSDWNQTDDTQLDYIKGKPVIPQGLPEGTANQTLRHNGTDWVSTSRITNVENETGSAFTISSPNVSQIASRAGTSSSYINLKHNDNGIHIYSYVSGSEQIFRISPSGTTGDRLQLRTTTTYMPDEIMIRHKNFNVYQNGKIQSSNLAGTGTARAVLDSNGVFMRDETIAVTPLQSIVFDKLITTPSTMVEITAAELGIDISQDILLDKLVSFEAYFYDENNRSMSTVDIREKVATRDTVAIDFAQQYPAGTMVRVLLTLR